MSLWRLPFLAVAALSLATRGDEYQVRDGGAAPSRIAGIVTTAAGPLAEATVTATGTTWRRVTALTDPAGRFTLDALPPDVYTVMASKDEYLDAAFGTSRPIVRGGMPTGVHVGAGDRIDGLALTMIRGGAIAGTVRHPTGQPVAATLVTLAVRDRAGIAGMDRTDAAGTFRIAGLPRGDYDVIAYPASGAVPVYYPGVTSPDRAHSVQVDEDASDRHVEITLVQRDPVRVSGSVRDSGGLPAAGARVSAISPTGPSLAATTAADGRFVFERVVPGQYLLTIAAPARSAASEATAARGQWARTEIHVGEQAVSGLDLVLQPLLLFSGRVDLDLQDGSLSVDPAAIRVFLSRPGFHPYEIPVSADGTFRREMVAGLHVVSAIAPGTKLRLRSAMAGGRDLIDAPPVFDAAAGDVTDVVLTFTDRATELSGRVLTPNHEPVAACVVIAFPADRRLWNEHSPRLVVARPSTEGRFVMSDLLPGDYLLAIVDDLEPVSWKTPGFLASIASTATPVRVPEGVRTRRDLRVQR